MEGNGNDIIEVLSPNFPGANEERRKKYKKIADNPAEIRLRSHEHKSAGLSLRRLVRPFVYYFLGFVTNISQSFQ